MSEEVVFLTVYCLSFNHVNYIRKTLDGFVRQKTKYKYEVIVHDDASTDGTQEIIKEYARNYPDIIKPILQTENQYSKKAGIFKTFILPQIKGKYIAICEGDDYWCDDKKIDMQIRYMESHPECSLCVHNTEMIKENGEKVSVYFNKCKKEKNYSAEEIIEAGGGGLFHTSSFLFPSVLRINKPDSFSMYGAGDYPLAIYLATKGVVHYFPNVMSKYRVLSKNSWTSRISSSTEKYIHTMYIQIEDLEKLDRITKYKYSKSFTIAQNRLYYNILIKEHKLSKILFNKKYNVFMFEKGLLSGMKKIAKLIINR